MRHVYRHVRMYLHIWVRVCLYGRSTAEEVSAFRKLPQEGTIRFLSWRKSKSEERLEGRGANQTPSCWSKVYFRCFLGDFSSPGVSTSDSSFSSLEWRRTDDEKQAFLSGMGKEDKRAPLTKSQISQTEQEIGKRRRADRAR